MHDPSIDPAVEARLRDFLAAELRRAEDDFAGREPTRERATRRIPPIGAALVTVIALMVGAAVVAPRVAGPGGPGPAAIPMGDDGLPLSIGGVPVIRGDAIATLAGTGPFLAGGTLVLNTGPCLSRSERAQLGCGEDWTLVSGPLDHPTAMVTLDGAPDAPGFVRTSAAPTVVRIDTPSRIPGVLAVESIVWRQPTKGPIPEAATPPQGGMINEALIPDFVSVWGADGLTIVGYVPKRYAVSGGDVTPGGTPSNPPQDLPIPVYGEDLNTLVGHMVPGVGFVALGATVTPVPPSASAGPSAGASPPPGEPSIQLRYRTDVACPAMALPLPLTFRIDAAADEDVVAVTADGTSYHVSWSSGFVGGTETERDVLDPAGQVVARDGDVLNEPTLKGYPVCATSDSIYVLASE